MVNVKDKLTPFEEDFFNKLENYLDKPIYFYGSILRDDYFPQMSDIDIDIFTDNENSTITMLQNFLNLPNNAFKKSIYRLDKKNSTVVNGYKSRYIDEDNKMFIEISVYNEKNKYDIMYEHQNKPLIIPYYITCLLIFIKVLHYQLGLLPVAYYSSCKKWLINTCVNNNKPDFITI